MENVLEFQNISKYKSQRAESLHSPNVKTGRGRAGVAERELRHRLF